MQGESPGALQEFTSRITQYLPTLTAGFLVLAVGVILGWLAKRLVVRVLVWLRLDRLGGRIGWRAAFGKGDVRAALYNLLGSLAMIAVTLIFLDNSLQIWGLVVLSDFIHSTVVYLPNLALVGIIVGIGLLLATFLEHRVEEFLDDEDVPRSRLLAKIFKAALLAIIGALALWQLGFARNIVFWGFVITFGAIGIAFALAVGLGSAAAIQRGWESLGDRERKGRSGR